MRAQAEEELKFAQMEFERQSEVTRLLLEGIGPAHAAHSRHLQVYPVLNVSYIIIDKHC